MKLKKSNKSKTAFKTLLCALSKLVEQAKMHLGCVFKMVEYMEENILINDNDDIYLIDFEMASQKDTKKKRKLFEKKQLKYLAC
ncbi:kinase-like domain-containing protein [Rhizophagus irregularis DAOM 181602=DAOM 197198]|nr:kinase-like domain-containing protein [Rhizophagus irregularis DAOM 181602=DAOM 197198]